MHWPFFIKHDTPSFPPPAEYNLGYAPGAVAAAWAELQTLHASGKARAIGVSNFTEKKLARQLFTETFSQIECAALCTAWHGSSA